MRIIVVSDTHMPKKGNAFPESIKEELSNSDLIIHAGDWSSLEVYDQLASYGKVQGVQGNIEEEEVRDRLPEKLVLELDGYKIGVVHGHGDKKTTEKRVVEAFEGEEVDLIIFGHSHLPLTRWVKKTLLFNPGSLMDKRKLPYTSYGIIDTTHGLDCMHRYIL
ncbi:MULTISPECIES: metallophosphoesterase family protein [Pontibacillus]|uniref:Phosphoesterase n=1 Tax=Pontibacillus chungwhensis TaxID=265426 RepID=A0ABY8UTF7_9BACI|nr:MULTISPECIES: metallophosphoesterase family protein [Pontibacillus]MCD5323104.1 metallophosphatase family protein [Pontibacillus sp. HN14]WIF96493.1 metallophosphoesterase family protein [Pontibacillus chungwhensis]